MIDGCMDPLKLSVLVLSHFVLAETAIEVGQITVVMKVLGQA